VRFRDSDMYDGVIMADVSVTLKQHPNGLWRASSEGFEVAARSKDMCLRKVREASKIRSRALILEVIPHLVGVAEAAEILGWDKRRVATYIQRGSFPEPVEALAGGRVWAVDDIKDFARAFRARQRKRASRKPRR
jgi:hypothetical protein